MQGLREGGHFVWELRMESAHKPRGLSRHVLLLGLGASGVVADGHEIRLQCFPNKRESASRIDKTNLSLESELSHGEGALLLLLTESLLGSLR